MFSIKNDLLFEIISIIFISILYYTTRKEERSTILYFTVILICIIILNKHVLPLNNYKLNKNVSNKNYGIPPEILQPPLYIGDGDGDGVGDEEVNEEEIKEQEYTVQNTNPNNFTNQIEDVSDVAFESLTNPSAYKRSIREGGKGIYTRTRHNQSNQEIINPNNNKFWNDVISDVQNSRAKGFGF